MSLGGVDPYSWGELERHIERAIEGRTDVDAAAREVMKHAFDIVLHGKTPALDRAAQVPLCGLCGHSSISNFVGGNRRPSGEVDFEIAEDSALRGGARKFDAQICWTCLYSDVDDLDPGLSRMRRILLSSPGGDKHLPTLTRAEDSPRVRGVTGPCDLCERRGPALQGPPKNTYCLACYRAAQAVRAAEMNRWQEQRRLRDERFEQEVTDYLQEMWAIAIEDARGAVQAMERRGEIKPLHKPPPGAPSRPDNPSSPDTPPPESAPIPDAFQTVGSRLARAVTKRVAEKLGRVPLLSAARSAWDRRPTRVSLRWSELAGEGGSRGGEGDSKGPVNGPPERAELPGPKGSQRSGPPPIPTENTRRDRDAAHAIRFLDSEVSRALRHSKSHSGDLMGDRQGIHTAARALQPDELSRPMLERLLCSVSMLRQTLETGTTFYDYTGDELMHEEIVAYDVLATQLDIGVHKAAIEAMEGGLIVHGGAREERARVAGAIGRITASRTRDPVWNRGPAPFRYIESEDLYAMSAAAQEEVRRQMLITPPTITVFGTDDLDAFIEQTPRRVSARIVTYLFMNGQEHVDVTRGDVHVSPPPPARKRPTPP